MKAKKEHLTFEELEAEVESYAKVADGVPAGKVELWSFAAGLLVAGFGSLLATLVGGDAGLRIIQAALALEILGLSTSMVLRVKRNWQTFRRSKHAYARELDTDFVKFQRFVDWLREFPGQELDRRLRYLRDRKTGMSYRLGLLTGGVERLGVLPVLVALYLQFKDWEFGNWQALRGVHVVGGLLLWALFLLYAASWYLINLKTRLDIYESLLAEAVLERP